MSGTNWLGGNVIGEDSDAQPSDNIWWSRLRQLNPLSWFGGGSQAGGSQAGGASAGGVTPIGNGLYHVPGIGVIRGYDGKIYPNTAARGSDGRLYNNPGGYDLQALDQLLRAASTMPRGRYPAVTDILNPGQLPVRLGDQPGSVNIPNPTAPINLAAYVIDPRLTTSAEPNVMPGATSALDNYRRAYQAYRAPYAGNSALNDQTYAAAYRKATGEDPPSR